MDHVRCTEEFIIDLFCRVDGQMAGVAKHPLANLWPSEVVTLGILFALRGRSERAFYGWLSRDEQHRLFPRLPDRTRLFRLLAAHAESWTRPLLAGPTFFAVADTFGIELTQTRRLGRSPRQIGKKGFCAGRWIAGLKWGLLINDRGEVLDWLVTTANAYDADACGAMVASCERSVVLADSNFHKSPHHRKNDPDPPNLMICPRGQWNQRRLIETVLSMFANVMRLKKLTERAWPYVRAHLASAVAAFNLLIHWADPDRAQLSIAGFDV